MSLPISTDYQPMEASLSSQIPVGPAWEYEPKWDGFRCLAFRQANEVQLRSKNGQPLERYFPELVRSILTIKAEQFVFDSEIVVLVDGEFSFDDLLQRIHPAASRIARLSSERPAQLIVFDLLVDAQGRSLVGMPLEKRKKRLDEFARRFLLNVNQIELCASTKDVFVARRWLGFSGEGVDGIVAKRLDLPYQSGERTGMIKVKPLRTADCVVGGFRYSSNGQGIGSLLLGLYNEEGLLDHVGFCSSFNGEQRKQLVKLVQPLIKPPGFTGNAPGGPSRWSRERSTEWQPLAPKLVAEVQYTNFSGGRFRHGTKFLHWRPDKSPRQCTLAQLQKDAHAVAEQDI